MITRQTVNKNGKFVILAVAFFWVIFLARAAQVQLLDGKKFRDYADSQHKSTMPLAARRGTIYDCKGRPLAYDIEAMSYSVNPKYMKKPSEAAEKLARITGKPKSYWNQQFAKRPGFLMVARRVSQEMAYRVRQLRYRDPAARAAKPRGPIPTACWPPKSSAGPTAITKASRVSRNFTTTSSPAAMASQSTCAMPTARKSQPGNTPWRRRATAPTFISPST